MKHFLILSHTKWDCKYQMVWIPKYRKKGLDGRLRKELGPVLRELATHKKGEVTEGQWVLDRVHILISIPPSGSAGGRVICEPVHQINQSTRFVNSFLCLAFPIFPRNSQVDRITWQTG